MRVCVYVCAFFVFGLAYIVSPGASDCLFPHTSLRSLLGRCGAQGLLASLFAAVPSRFHSAWSIVANWFLRRRVLQAAVLAGGILARLACSGGVCLISQPEHLVFFHGMTKVALPRALRLTWLLLAVPAGPLARVGSAAVHCELFVF